MRPVALPIHVLSSAAIHGTTIATDAYQKGVVAAVPVYTRRDLTHRPGLLFERVSVGRLYDSCAQLACLDIN